jgi:2-dehydro-3-deoxyphosphogluconate aldolase/(4S)-4-hydroxy-2-oxoglutarate aldolase
MTVRTPPGSILLETGVVAVLRAATAEQYPPVIEALARGGVRSIELTLTTKGVFDAFPAIREQAGTNVEIGIGTVTSAQEVALALAAGADFIVTPITDVAVVGEAVTAGVPVYTGGMTPTELHAGWSAGAAAVKLFPASAVGPGYIAQLRGPLPELKILPSGGIGVDDAAEWIKAGATAVSIGSPLLRDAFFNGNLDELTERSSRLVDTVAKARS